MRVILMFLLLVVHSFTDNTQHEGKVSVLPDSWSNMCLKSVRLMEDHNRFSTSYSTIFGNKNLKHYDWILPLSVKTTLTNNRLRKTSNRLKSVNPNDTFRPDEGELNSTRVPGHNGINETIDDEWNGFNETFEEKAREDGYRITSPEVNPYSVLLITKTSKAESLCTGSLLTEEWVLTAGHCVTTESKRQGVQSVHIYAGYNSYEEVKYGSRRPATAQDSRAAEFHAHPGFKHQSEKHDIALVRAKKKFNITKAVQTIRLSTEPWRDVGYRTCIITGFGKVNYGKKSHPDDYKRKTNSLSVKNPCKCNFRLKQMFGKVYPTKSYICAKPVKDYGICSGDSGGGLVCNGEIRATAMMIIQMYDTYDCEASLGHKLECASDHGLTVFLDTCPYLRWISRMSGVPEYDLISSECQEVSGQPRAERVRLESVVISLLVALSIR